MSSHHAALAALNMTIRALLIHRRKELVEFVKWRFQSRNWSAVFCYMTGCPRWLAKKLASSRPIEWTCKGRQANVVTLRDIFRAEDAALHLGFKPTLPAGRSNRYVKPPPPNLPAATDPSVRI